MKLSTTNHKIVHLNFSKSIISFSKLSIQKKEFLYLKQVNTPEILIYLVFVDNVMWFL